MIRNPLTLSSIGIAALWLGAVASARCCGGNGAGAGCGAPLSRPAPLAASADPVEKPSGGAASAEPAPDAAPGKPEAKAAEGKGEETLLSSYFAIWKALGKDELKGVPEAKRALVTKLQAALKAAPKALGDAERERRRKILGTAEAAASKLDPSDLKRAREGFGALSRELRKFTEAFPAEADAYVVYCDMAKKSWLQDTPRVLNPYYGAAMATCGSVIHKPASKPAKTDQPLTCH